MDAVTGVGVQNLLLFNFVRQLIILIEAVFRPRSNVQCYHSQKLVLLSSGSSLANIVTFKFIPIIFIVVGHLK